MSQTSEASALKQSGSKQDLTVSEKTADLQNATPPPAPKSIANMFIFTLLSLYGCG